MSQPSKISLSEEQKVSLSKLVENPSISATVRHRSQILLELDSSTGNNTTCLVCAQRVGVAERTVRKIKRLYLQQGIEAVIQVQRNPNSDKAHKKIDDEIGARILFLAQNKQPDGYKRWTIALLAKILLETYQISLAIETIRLFLKKNGILPLKSQYWRTRQE